MVKGHTAMVWSSGAVPTPYVIAMSLLPSRWLTSKHRIAAVVGLVIIKAFIQKLDIALVRIIIALEVMFDAVTSRLHLGELGAIGVGVRWCPATGYLLLLTFLVEI